MSANAFLAARTLFANNLRAVEYVGYGLFVDDAARSIGVAGNQCVTWYMQLLIRALVTRELRSFLRALFP